MDAQTKEVFIEIFEMKKQTAYTRFGKISLQVSKKSALKRVLFHVCHLFVANKESKIL